MSRIIHMATIAALLLSARAAFATGEDTLYQNEYLYPDQKIVHACYYKLIMQSDGNLVLYEGSSALWASNTVGRGAYAVMQGDGNLVVYNWSNQAVWASGTNGNAGARLVLQGDRNLVIYASNGQALWASNTQDTSGIGRVIQPCNWESVKTNGYNGYDLAGGDIGYYNISGGTQNWCGYFCSALSNCVAYTYVPAGYQDPTYARCWVKNSIPNGYSTAPSGFFSGRILETSHYEGNL